MKYFGLVLLILFMTSSAFANTASISGTSYSISLEESSSYVGYHLFEAYFTTYDGNRYSFPLYDYYNGYYYYSQELKKVGSLYMTDYCTILDSYTIDGYGEISLNLGSDDINGNGIDDVCEKSMPFNKSITGNWYSYDNTSGAITGSLSKAANSNNGTYSLVVHDTYSGDISTSGNYSVGELSGTLNYSKISNSIVVTYISNWMQSEETYETTYDILNENSIRMNAVETLPNTILSRDENTYTALVELSDGDSNTSWPDYQKWLVKIQDSNDTDGDGIPDLSDLNNSNEPPETTISSGPSGTITANNVTFSYTGTDDFTPTNTLLYSYKLEGYDTSWSSYSTSTSKSYSNLPDGSYTFYVKAKDEADNIDSTPASRSFYCCPDVDNDDVCDDFDNCPGVYNPEQTDTDEDGFGNECDEDDDDDGMPDDWEEQYEGINPLVDDASDDLDGDGILNYQEYLNGTDPLRPPFLPFLPLLLGD